MAVRIPKPAIPDEYLVDNRVYTDQRTFDLERERIFFRTWNFVCHESEIKEPGDFITTIVAGQQSSWRLGAAVLSGFAVLALVVAGVGLYGVIGYEISQRRREWAIRVALGADRAAIVKAIVGRSVRLVVAGVVPGLLIAAAFGRWVRPLLYQTSGFDPPSYVIAAFAMIAVALVASALPALRASNVDPHSALRG